MKTSNRYWRFRYNSGPDFAIKKVVVKRMASGADAKQFSEALFRGGARNVEMVLATREEIKAAKLIPSA